MKFEACIIGAVVCVLSGQDWLACVLVGVAFYIVEFKK